MFSVEAQSILNGMMIIFHQVKRTGIVRHQTGIVTQSLIALDITYVNGIGLHQYMRKTRPLIS